MAWAFTSRGKVTVTDVGSDQQDSLLEAALSAGALDVEFDGTAARVWTEPDQNKQQVGFVDLLARCNHDVYFAGLCESVVRSRF